MIGVMGSVRGLTVMIATEGIFVWCAVTPTSKSSQVNTLPKAKRKKPQQAEQGHAQMQQCV
jgi:ribosomal protein L21